jgi:very-short-patch-repair endonuclease
MKCKICNKEFKGKIGLNTHLRTHGVKSLDYLKKYEELKIPKCICGKNRKQKGSEIKFISSCGDDVCIKNIQREKRLNFMRENPKQTAWRTKNISYPEKVFIKLLEAHGLDKQYLIIREKSFFPYFVDFAFEGVNVAVEIDGAQHELPERKESDNKKDKLLNALNWRVFRVTAKEIRLKGDEVIDKIISFIGNNDIVFENCGIELSKSKRQIELDSLNLERDKNNGLTNKVIQSSISQRRVERPPYEQLKQEVKELGYVGTGKKYGVSDNGIRRWVKTYEKYNF